MLIPGSEGELRLVVIVQIVIRDDRLVCPTVAHVEQVDLPQLDFLVTLLWGEFISLLLLTHLDLLCREMLVHMDHMLLALHLLEHVNFKLRDSD
jgi:hypothetical protein